jgi:hypothetical protein
MMTPFDLAKTAIILSEEIEEGLKQNSENKIEIPIEFLSLNDRQKMFFGLVILDYIARSRQVDAMNLIKVSFFEAYLILMFGIAIASRSKFKKEEEIVYTIFKNGTLSDDNWFANDKEIEQLEVFKEEINKFVNNELLDIFQIVRFLRQFTQPPLELLIDYCAAIYNKLPNLIYIIEFAQSLKHLLNSKNFKNKEVN